MRRNLVEFVFEDISLNEAWKFLQHSAAESAGQVTIAIPHLSKKDSQSLKDLTGDPDQLFADPEASLAVTLPRIEVQGGYIDNPCIWIRPFGPSASVMEVNFYTTSVSLRGPNIAAVLHAIASAIAVQIHASSFYGGLEPATDRDTRLFTDSDLGPLRWEELCAL
jgi:hypothetical protein